MAPSVDVELILSIDGRVDFKQLQLPPSTAGNASINKMYPWGTAVTVIADPQARLHPLCYKKNGSNVQEKWFDISGRLNRKKVD